MAISPKSFQQMTRLIAGKMLAGRYEVRLAETPEEVAASQRLRYEVLFREGGGQVSEHMRETGREQDEWDEAAFHVLVFDADNNNQVVGSIRLVSSELLADDQVFYTEKAFNIDGLRAKYTKILELSRACVSPQGRGGAILMLMWKFSMQFIEKNGYDVMIGCASFSGMDYRQHKEILSYLYDKHLADADLMPVPVVDNHVAIKDFAEKPAKGKKRGKVPTMLRGYLKIGARISEHAILDARFNTTFVAIYVDADDMFNRNHALVYKST